MIIVDKEQAAGSGLILFNQFQLDGVGYQVTVGFGTEANVVLPILVISDIKAVFAQ